MTRFLYILAVLYCLFGSVAQAQTLHLLGFFDTDTTDMANKGHLKTIQRLTELKTKLEKEGGLTVSIHILQSPIISNIEQTVRNLKCNPDDAILCILGAHGYNDAQTKAPRIIFPDPKKTSNILSEKSISLQEFAQTQLFTKNVRLKIVVGEACNVIIPLQKKSRNVPPGYIREAVQRYFLQASGEIIVWSSSVGQPSYINADGGYYSRHFFEVLDEHLSDRNYINNTWELLLTQAGIRTQKFVQEGGETQTPDKLLKGVRYDGNQLPPAITQGELPSAQLGYSMAISTNRGRENVSFANGDTMRLRIDVSKPSYLNVLYQFADGSNTLLLENYYIPDENTKKNFPIPNSWECFFPFGKETLICWASETPFDPLPPTMLKKESGVTFILGDLPTILKTIRRSQSEKIAKKRGFKEVSNGAAPVQGLLEDKIPILTVAKRR